MTHEAGAGRQEGEGWKRDGLQGAVGRPVRKRSSGPQLLRAHQRADEKMNWRLLQRLKQTHGLQLEFEAASASFT